MQRAAIGYVYGRIGRASACGRPPGEPRRSTRTLAWSVFISIAAQRSTGGILGIVLSTRDQPRIHAARASTSVPPAKRASGRAREAHGDGRNPAGEVSAQDGMVEP